MTNKEIQDNVSKANEIAKDAADRGFDRVGAFCCAMEAMEWKDEQEIEFLQSLMFQAPSHQVLNVVINNRIKLLKGE